MQLTVLGCYSATPRTFNHTTSQVLQIKNHLFLIDCGEGTQVQLRRNKVKFSRIKHIFISHLHGDHFFGLVGLISTFNLLGRKTDLHIYGPKGIKEIIVLQLKYSKTWTCYNLYFHELESNQPQVLLEDDKVIVETIPLNHRVYTNGFLFKEKPGDRKLLMNEVLNYEIDKAYYKSIVKGKDILLENGDLIPNEKLTAPPKPTKSYAFCSDTAYYPIIVEQIKNATALYHEATFLESHAHLCASTLHSTAKQAAQIAQKAQVQQLILGHYSTRYDDINNFKIEAQEFFENVICAQDGLTITFD